MELIKYILYIILLKNILLAYLRPPMLDDFTKRDCYESITFPQIFLELSHNSPIGPPYLFVIFHFHLFPLYNETKEIYQKRTYHFKRTNKPCISSLVFTSKGIAFKVMNIGINIYLYTSNNLIANIFYTFGYLYKPAIYQLRDPTNEFAVAAEINKRGKYHIQNTSDLQNELESYLITFKMNNDSICVVSRNNGILLLQPIYNDLIPNGLITNIIIQYVNTNLSANSFMYAAFECNNKEYKHSDNVLLIDGESVSDELSFMVIYWKFIGNIALKKFAQFYLNNITRINLKDYINNYKYYQIYKKIFLVEEIRTNMICPDGTSRILLRSKQNITHHAIEIKDVEDSFDITQRVWIFRFPQDPCRDIIYS